MEPVTAPEPHETRRTARAAAMLTDGGATVVRHARARRARWIGAVFAGAAAGALVFGGAAAVTAAVAGPVLSDRGGLRLVGSDYPATEAAASPTPSPPAIASIPTLAAAPPPPAICTIPAVTAALGSGDDAAAIAAAGGAATFRDAVASGRAPCVRLDDPAHDWIVLNKLRPLAPIDYRPASLALPAGVRSLAGGLKTDAAAALSTMVGAAAAEGAGEIALDSGFRSYATQQNNYGNGGPSIDPSVARPGYSEHQSGLAADVVACSGGCGTLDALATTPQGAWIAANSWRYGWIVRYENGKTEVTGYVPEPWHLRYIGSELAAAYHAGNWHSLEEFLGLPAAPGYAH